MGRLVVPRDPRNDLVDNYLKNEFQRRLMDYGLKYMHASAREIKTGEYTDDRICAPRDGFLNNLWNGPQVVADITRSVESSPKLEIRVINPDYRTILNTVVKNERGHSPIDILIR